MKKLIFFFLLLPVFSYGQFLEAGIIVGASNYMGDLSNNSSTVYFKQMHPAGGVFARYNLLDQLTIRGGFTYARISGTDANSPNESIRRRNLSFRSNILEFALLAEVNIPGFQPYALYRPFSPYLFGGVALTSFNPQAELEGEWIDLQPLGTEGQGMPSFDNPYSKTSLSFPFGLGFKFAITDKLNIGLEAGARFALSDYLDDVGGNYVSYPELQAGNGDLAAALGNRTGEYLGSEPVIVATGTRRGDAQSNDWYFIGGITLSYNFLDNGLVGSRGKSRRRSGCRTD